MKLTHALERKFFFLLSVGFPKESSWQSHTLSLHALARSLSARFIKATTVICLAHVRGRDPMKQQDHDYFFLYLLFGKHVTKLWYKNHSLYGTV